MINKISWSTLFIAICVQCLACVPCTPETFLLPFSATCRKYGGRCPPSRRCALCNLSARDASRKTSKNRISFIRTPFSTFFILSETSRRGLQLSFRSQQLILNLSKIYIFDRISMLVNAAKSITPTYRFRSRCSL